MISVIIVNYHSADLTKRAVDSVLTEAEETEIFVIDNTAARAERQTLNSVLPKKVRQVFNLTNEGFARACNKAYAASTGEWIFLLNPDAYVLPGALGYLRDFLLRHRHAGAVGPRIYWDDRRTFLLPPSILPSQSREFWQRVGRASHLSAFVEMCITRNRQLKAWKATSPLKQRALSGGHVMLRRSAVEKSGGLFDESFFMYYEDSDLCMRLRKAGYSLYLQPRAEVVHSYIQGGSKTELMEESRRIYFRKHFSDSFLLKLAGKLPDNTFSLPETCTQMGKSEVSLHFDIPSHLQKGWLFEWSPLRSFSPSVGCFGKGATMEIPADMLKMLGPGRYYSRVSPLSSFTLSDAVCWSWEI
jgi:GT2 family glycosyltransferase